MAQIHPQTETAVANEALSLIRQPDLLDLDSDQNNVARIVRKHFAGTRDAMLRRYPWNFATERALLTNVPPAPAFGFKYRYALPADCLKAREVIGCRNDQWKVERRMILSDRPPQLKLLYTRNATEVSLWDALFRTAFTRALAVACGPELAADDERIKALQEEARGALFEAFPSDAAEGTPDDMDQGDWLAVRG